MRGPVPEGATAVAIIRTLSLGSLGEDVVAEGPVNAAGWFRLRYTCPAHGPSATDLCLEVRVRAADGEWVAQSAPVLAPARRATIHLQVHARRAGACEVVRVEQRIGSRLECGVAGIDALEPDALEEVAEWIDLPPERLALFQQARRCELPPDLPASFFYALGRTRAPLELDLRPRTVIKGEVTR